jgi:septal ring factor EnvC (AmiA/AmiB activator)
MEVMDIETITTIANLIVTTLIAAILVLPKLHKEQAAAAANSVAAAQGTVSAMELVIAELRKEIAKQVIELLETRRSVAELNLKIVQQETAHIAEINLLGKQIKQLEEVNADLRKQFAAADSELKKLMGEKKDEQDKSTIKETNKD